MKATNITATSCSVLSFQGGQNFRKAYVNSADGRTAFAAECASCENYTDVMTAWGDTPTVVYDEPIQSDIPDTPTIETRVSTLESNMDALLTGLEGAV